MADLDDFFAKKDKKKSKAKPKFVTAEELVKNLEDTSKREAAAKPKKQPEPSVATVAAVAAVAPVVEVVASDEISKPKEAAAAAAAAVVEQQPTEEEWKEFEEEQRKDYTGLKIGQLTMNDEDDNSPTDGDEEDVDSDGNMNVDIVRRSGGGPWKKVIPAEDVTQIPMEIEKSSSKVYISPALRFSQQQQQGNAPGSRLKMRNRAAPDITNADYFPTLGAARPEEQRKKKNEPAFEEVRHGSRLQRVQEQSAAPVSIANRFQTLDEDES